MKGNIKLHSLKGIPVYIHWSFPAGGLLIFFFVGFKIQEAIYYCIAYTILIIVHELSHAYAAYFFQLKVHHVEISGVGGTCYTDYPPTFKVAFVYSSAGILAEVILLVVTILGIHFFGRPDNVFAECTLITFTYVNAFMLVWNMIPLKFPNDNFGTDGFIIWKLLENRFKKKRPYSFPDTSATFHKETHLTQIQELTPLNFTYGIEILNDNQTTMEFVVTVLMKHLVISEEEAIAIMLDIHMKGGHLISTPSYDEAINIASAITSDAKENGFSFICRPVNVQPDAPQRTA